MSQDSLTTTILTAALASGLCTAILSKLLDIISMHLKQKNDEKVRLAKEKEEFYNNYLHEKREAYIEALKKLAIVRAAFDITYENVCIDSQIREMIENMNRDAPLMSAKIRLYSTDEIYHLFWRLSKWTIFSFPRNYEQQRLMENGKEMFSLYTTILARLMQNDLGYRDFVKKPDLIKCPKCGKEHDAYKTCECGLSWSETFDTISKDIAAKWKEKENLQNQNVVGEENVK